MGCVMNIPGQGPITAADVVGNMFQDPSADLLVTRRAAQAGRAPVPFSGKQQQRDEADHDLQDIQTARQEMDNLQANNIRLTNRV
ncbi:hypothetical protein BGX23_011020 [Mortierella sp. AD031]|nr:hypothetical protein BGX23_011020 [Mortierella sp. AD031]